MAEQSTPTRPTFTAWLEALEARQLANLRFAEVTRALRALSSAYVERRHEVSRGRTLESAGKRAAFALFYAPLHFIAVDHVVRMLGLDAPAPRTIVDLGCGTGVAGAAWALAAGAPVVTGIDRHPWAVDESRWNYRALGVSGHARRGDITGTLSLGAVGAVIAAYTLNELAPVARRGVENALLEAARHGARVLIVEPIARGIIPWWDDTAVRVRSLGGRADEWRVPIDLPPLLRTLDKAAGLDHHELKMRTLAIGAR